MTCPTCGAENPSGQRFCGSCGSALAQLCGSCGAASPPGQRFCGSCGAQLVEANGAGAASGAPTPMPVPAASASAHPEPTVAERRLVTVLFADLVGFTTLSEGRDAEDVRELLSRYFETAGRLIELYGGIVEKFIGDAVMAVWGVPAATEHDAERAVRAAMDLVASVSALGDELGAPLQARAGVLSGEAAVNLGATGQGMVAGDLVNTASRVQSAAEPGTVFVGEATRRASEPTIVYEHAGSFELKGKEGQTELWRALRVVSGRGGSLKSTGLEAPFVGRERELRQIKELFHVSAEEKFAQLVSVTGIAGIGKSRLAWEFYKYFDGIDQIVYWHRGRCLAYGEGVTYWALADMVRMRCGIAEDDEPEAAQRKLEAALSEYLLDAGEREFVHPRLAQLLGLGDHDGLERQDLHSAWRLFFERLSDTNPVVLAFEDMQWADSSLLDFVEHLLDWSRNHPIYVISLARPELLERRSDWGAGQRHFTSIYLEPLSRSAMEELLAGLVPGLPTGLRDEILARAEGVPLYAVETVRMLLDRGLLAEQGSSYAVVGEIESLAVPETLHALAAARLDGLSADERRVVQDGAVLGKTFTATALGALTGLNGDTLQPLLAGLVRKELLGVQADPRSPEHGQYGFLQDLLRQVAYDTLSKHDRRAKHLSAAEYLAGALADDEVPEVIASHLLDAYRLDPDAADAATLREKARAALLAAGERAASLGATAEGQTMFERAAELADEPAEQAAALYRAGDLALMAATSVERVAALLERAHALSTEVGDTHGAARAARRLASLDMRAGNPIQALNRLEAAYETIAGDEPGPDHSDLLGSIASAAYFSGDNDRVREATDAQLDLAEALPHPAGLVGGWMSTASLVQGHRPEEARGLLQLALETARDHDLLREMAGAISALSDLGFHRDRYLESLAYLEQSLDVGRRLGHRSSEWFDISEQTYALAMLGRWDEALLRLEDIPAEQLGVVNTLLSPVTGVLEIYLWRGQLDSARELLARYDELGRSDDVQTRACIDGGVAAVRLAEGRFREALAAAEQAIASRETFGIGFQPVKQGMRHGLEAALALGEPDVAERLLAIVDDAPAGLRPPFLSALAERFRGRLAGDDPRADRHFAAAVAGFRELEIPFDEALSALEYGEWLVARGRPGEAEPLLDGARETFERLRATPWLERARAAMGSQELESVSG